MAARENQGYLIAVILLTLVSVILAVLTYFGFAKMNEYASQKAAADVQLRDEQRRGSAYEAQSNILKSYLGLENHSVSEVPTLLQNLQSTGQTPIIEETSVITTAYETDVKSFVNPPEGAEATYRGLVNDFGKTLAQAHNDANVLTNRIREVERAKETELAAMQQELAKAQELLTAARNDFESEKQRHAETRTTMAAALQKAEEDVQQSRSQLSTAEQNHARQSQDFQQQLATAAETIESLKDRLSTYEDERFDVADGRVVSVSPTEGMVYINLGSDDRVRPSQTFAIYDQSLEQFQRNEQKAMVEITRILGPHLAEARLTSSSPTRPVLTRDHVVTSTWDPGYAVPIALTGMIDLDGDGLSDLDRLASLVRQNGGEVVSYVDPEGKVVGALDSKTRFLVVGTDPTEVVNAKDEWRGAMASSMADMLKAAEDHNVQVVSVREFLNSMGYRSEAQVERLDSQPTFAPRQPPARPNPNSAFGGDDAAAPPTEPPANEVPPPEQPPAGDSDPRDPFGGG